MAFYPCKIIISHSLIDKMLMFCYNSGNNQTNVMKHSGDCVRVNIMEGEQRSRSTSSKPILKNI